MAYPNCEVKCQALTCDKLSEFSGIGSFLLSLFRDQTSLFPIQTALTSGIFQFGFIAISKQRIQDLKAPKNNRSIFDPPSNIVSGKGQLSVRPPTGIGSTHCLMLVTTSDASFRQKVAFVKWKSPSLFSCDIWLHFSYVVSQIHASKRSRQGRGIPNPLA